MTIRRGKAHLDEFHLPPHKLGDVGPFFRDTILTKSTAKTDMRSAFSSYFSYIKRNREKILTAYADAYSFCRALIEDASKAPLPESAQALVAAADLDERHYLISSTYAVLIGDDRRRELSAYFTPPVLAKAAIEASDAFLKAREHPTVLDPACGGGSFLTPVTRHLVMQKRHRGVPLGEACRTTIQDIRGIEIDAGLCALSQALLNDMLVREYGEACPGDSDAVRCEDALLASPPELYDLVIGNPPYGKVGAGADKSYLQISGLANLGGPRDMPDRAHAS